MVGKDGRTDAIAAAVRRSSIVCMLAVYSEFRIKGLVDKADVFERGRTTDVAAMLAFAKSFKPDLVIVGPEEPLEAGLVDVIIAELGVPCFGPTKSLARIETSKAWARALVDKYGIPGNPENREFRSIDGLADYVRELGDVVVKPDGLTGGKGVRVMGDHLHSAEEAIAYASELVASKGSAVVEERLEGEEFSLQTITDGRTFVHCPLVQDQKRLEDGDLGPNTGGMGSYSFADGLLPFLEASEVEQAKRTNEDVIKALEIETGEPYRGVLYGGFMATRNGLRLIEYNARFGDPEAMNVLPLLTTDFVEMCQATVVGRLSDVHVEFAKKASVCKYVVPVNYPDKHVGDDVITVDEDSMAEAGIECFWAATNLGDDGKVHLTGSRGVAFVGVGDSLVEAEALAERGASSVGGMVSHRHDIGTAELVQRRMVHMKSLRADV